MTTFKTQLNKAYQKKVIGTLDKSVRRVALFVDSELVNNTPVDTGRARSNWLPSLNAPDIRKVEPGAKPAIGPVLGAFKVLSDTILITNNLPYIRRLNDGHSQQSPAGFVEAVVDRGKRAFR